MAKKMILIMLVFALMAASAAYAAESGYTVRTVKVFSDGKENGELDLRFYEETPNVPYMGMNQYARLMRKLPFTVREMEDGTMELENRNGAALTGSEKDNRIFAQDWNAFLALPFPLEDKALGLKDMNVHYARITDVVYEGDPVPVTIDFAKYGIKLYTDENDIYLPVSTMTNLMTDIATNYLLFNGENLYAQRIDLEYNGIEGLYDSAVMQAKIHGEDRPADIIKQSYADLCLNFDYFFGHPGTAPLDKAIAEKGFDRALEDLGEDGLAIKKGLFSPKLADYLDAMMKLFMYWLDDGHTVFDSGIILISDPEIEVELAIGTSYKEYIKNSPFYSKQLLKMLIPIERSYYWGEETYREYGNTAIIRIDNFMPDEAAWDSYYRGEGDFPQDSLGIVVSGLKEASENPEIRNVIFDLTGNGGGSPDPGMAMLAMTTGQNQLHGKNLITGQPMTVTFEIDTNFDGIFDEKDKEVRYDYNYGILVSRDAFSMGNLFPFVFQEEGAVLIGEPSGGGTCSVQVGTDAEGFSYGMSSAQWMMTDSDINPLEDGCRIDVPIETVTIPMSDLMDDPIAQAVAAVVGGDRDIPSFQNYYQEERLDAIMNDWFGAQTQTVQVVPAD